MHPGQDALHRAVTASLPGRVAIIDRDGRVLLVNRRWERSAVDGAPALGRALIGASYLQPDAAGRLPGGEPAGEAGPCIRSVLARDAERCTLEYEWTDAGGRRWCELLVEALERPEGGAIISHFDITSRRLAEMEAARLRSESTYMARLGMLSELAGTLAHDLLQPLAAVIGNAQAAARLLEQHDLSEADLRQILDDIIRDGRRAADDVTRIGTLARRDDGGMTDVDVNAVVRDVVRIAAGDASVHRVGVILTLDSATPIVLADRVRLEQLVLNLVTNAIDAAGSGAATDPRFISVGTTVSGQAVTILVRDSGPGIRAEILGRLFEPFVTTKPHRLGMGLVVARRIANALGGRITIVSTAAGTAARCVLPLIAEEGP